MTDNTDTAIQEAFDDTENNPSWDFNVMGPSVEEAAAFKLEGERQRRERLLGLTFHLWEELGTTGYINLVSSLEEYVNNG